MRCGVCGGENYTRYNILPASLIGEWQLSSEEADYINRQQGELCNNCGSNLRSIALANAIRAWFGTNELLSDIVASNASNGIRLLEINEAGMLTPILKRLRGYQFGAYPDVDIHALPYQAATFDLVVHSDTLEHVPDPIHALQECRRVLKPGGALCFTVPIIVGRLTRSRDGLPKSFHGDPSINADDYLVRTEFGADVWASIMEAGFSNVEIHSVSYPAGIALIARNDWVKFNQRKSDSIFRRFIGVG